MSDTRRKSFVPLADSLYKLLRSYGIDIDVKAHQIVAMWPEIAGERIGKATVAEYVEGSVLFVKVKNSTWRNELIHFKAELLERINQKVGRGVIKDIKYV